MRIPAAVLLAFALGLGGCKVGEIEASGRVVRVEEDGGFWGLRSPEGQRFRLTNLPALFQREGIEIEIEGFVLVDQQQEGDAWIPVEVNEVDVKPDTPSGRSAD